MGDGRFASCSFRPGTLGRRRVRLAESARRYASPWCARRSGAGSQPGSRLQGSRALRMLRGRLCIGARSRLVLPEGVCFHSGLRSGFLVPPGGPRPLALPTSHRSLTRGVWSVPGGRRCLSAVRPSSCASKALRWCSRTDLPLVAGIEFSSAGRRGSYEQTPGEEGS